MVAHVFNLSTREVEMGQPELHKETLSQKKKERKKMEAKS